MNVYFIDNYRGGGSIELGDRVAVAPGAMFIADSDPNNSKLNQIPRFYIRGKVVVKQDAWIGANAIILPNMTVGQSAIVGAGAIVTKSVDDYAIVVGNPARKVGDVRFERNK